MTERRGISIHSFHEKIKWCGIRRAVKATVFCAILASSFINLSCENQREVAQVKENIPGNLPPVITSVDVLPKNPNRESNLDLIVRSEDAEGDMVTYRYQWIRNGEEILGENKNILKSGIFNKGDVIQVRVIPSDSKAEGKAFLSPPVKILNSPPVVQEVRIEPRIAYAQDRLRAHVKAYDGDGDPIRYTYQWEKNGVILEEEKAEVLEKGRFKRGDSIVVTVTPEDGEDRGIPKKSEPVTILNSPPVIVSSPPTSVEGSEYLYQVKAEDPDGDSILFNLKSGPKGMEIDKEKGLVRWTIQWRDRGTHPVEIEASDKDGAKCFQRYVLNVEIR